MDFSNRNAQQPAAPGQPAAASTSGASKRNKSDKGKWARIGISAVVAAVVILLVALVVLVSTGNSSNNQAKYVDSNKLQAVFLNTGQVYFGKIKTLNDNYFVVSNIYYLQTSGNNASGQTNTNTNVSLVKLGCELHEPYDQMVINSDQVTFWENLQDNGQVAKAVKTFQQQNPNGQKCADQSSSASTNSSNATQNAGSNSSNTSTNKSTNP